MAEIRAFPGIRPKAGLEQDIAALPYDVFNREEAQVQVADKPLSFLRIDRAETQLVADIDTYDQRVYQKARQLLGEMLADGNLVKEDKSCYYLYELTMNGRSQTGLVGCASIDDYENQVIKKHENTRADKEQDRICHVDTCNAQTGPIFLAYRSNDAAKAILDRVKESTPLFSFVSEDGVKHQGWKIDEDSEIAEVTAVFAAIPNLYIADGHHRAASAVAVGKKRRLEHPSYTGTEEFNYFLAVMFAGEELYIMDYNRVVKDLNGLTESDFLDRIAGKFNVEVWPKAYKPEAKGCIGMFLADRWYKLSLKQPLMTSDPVGNLDVSILQRELLEPILGIHNPKTDQRIDFIGGIRGLEELERRVHKDCAVAFAMYPTAIEELFAVADDNLLMPPKSTWFEPKLRSGLFIHGLD